MHSLSRKVRLFDIVNYGVLAIGSILALIPFLIVLSGSFTSEKELVVRGISFIPRAFSLQAYEYIINQNQDIVSSYEVTILVTAVGSLLSIVTTAGLAYMLTVRDLKLRTQLSFYIYFTMLFSGGMIPWYILCVRYLRLKNTILALILPMLVNPFYVFLMRTSFKSLPESLRESGIIDGAGEFRILFRIIIPISLPIMATVLLFYMLSYWNDFYQALFFIDKKNLIPLQYHLYRILSTLNFLATNNADTGGAHLGNVMLPTESVRLATTIVTIGPIIFVYPFIQKYFVKGITVGAVKG